MNEVTAEENTPTNDAPWRSPCSKGPKLGRPQDSAVVNAAPSPSGIVDSSGRPLSVKARTTPERKNSRCGPVRASGGALTALTESSDPTKVPGESTNPCTQSSFTTKNVFEVVQDFSDGIGESSRLQLDAADGLAQPITHNLQLLLVELVEHMRKCNFCNTCAACVIAGSVRHPTATLIMRRRILIYYYTPLPLNLPKNKQASDKHFSFGFWLLLCLIALGSAPL